jgi:hypothetical protein
MDFSTFVRHVVDEASQVPSDSAYLELALKNDSTIDGWVAEFGVYTGITLRILRQNTPSHLPVLGFDCFTGLPEDWHSGYRKGFFSNNGKVPDIEDNTTVVKGLFKDTLPPIMSLIGDKPARFIHIDCDLYEGANNVLTLAEKCIVPGTVLAFDELIGYPSFENHEIKAFYEFIQRTGHEFQVIHRFGPEKVICKITK